MQKTIDNIFLITIVLFRIFLFDLKSLLTPGGTNSIYANFDLSTVVLHGINGQSETKNIFSAVFNSGEEKYEKENMNENKNENESHKKVGRGIDEKKDGNMIKGNFTRRIKKRTANSVVKKSG